MVVVEGFGDKINMWVGLVFIAAGVFQLWLGYQGIEYHLGAVGAIAAVIAAFGFRIILPLTIGSYFGAVDVMGWDWYVGLVIAAPGLLFAAPYLVTAALEPFIGSGKTEPKSFSSGDHYPTRQSVSSALGSSNNALRPAQNKSIIEAEVIENNSKISPKANVSSKSVDTKIENNLSKYPNAKTVIDYDDRAKTAWLELDEIPNNLKENFIEALEKNPKQDVILLKNKILKEYEKVLNPFDKDEVNAAFGKAKAISDASAAEFKRVYEVLGDTISPDDLLEKVQANVNEVTPAKLKALSFAILTKHSNEMIKCLKNLGYYFEPMGHVQSTGSKKPLGHIIHCTKGIPTRVFMDARLDGITQYATEELKKLERWHGLKSG